jgi:hypothetical protein
MVPPGLRVSRTQDTRDDLVINDDTIHGIGRNAGAVPDR